MALIDDYLLDSSHTNQDVVYNLTEKADMYRYLSEVQEGIKFNL